MAKTESGVLIDDEVNVNIGFGYSIECELVMEQGTARLSDQHHTVTRDASGERHAICGSQTPARNSTCQDMKALKFERRARSSSGRSRFWKSPRRGYGRPINPAMSRATRMAPTIHQMLVPDMLVGVPCCCGEA